MGRQGTHKRSTKKKNTSKNNQSSAAEQQSPSVPHKRQRTYKRSTEALIRRAQKEISKGLARQNDQLDIVPSDPTLAASTAASSSADADQTPVGVTEVSLESDSEQALSPSEEEGSEARLAEDTEAYQA